MRDCSSRHLQPLIVRDNRRHLIWHPSFCIIPTVSLPSMAPMVWGRRICWRLSPMHTVLPGIVVCLHRRLLSSMSFSNASVTMKTIPDCSGGRSRHRSCCWMMWTNPNPANFARRCITRSSMGAVRLAVPWFFRSIVRSWKWDAGSGELHDHDCLLDSLLST